MHFRSISHHPQNEKQQQQPGIKHNERKRKRKTRRESNHVRSRFQSGRQERKLRTPDCHVGMRARFAIPPIIEATALVQRQMALIVMTTDGRTGDGGVYVCVDRPGSHRRVDFSPSSSSFSSTRIIGLST
uniref:Uncharacterized protein n=1 Tax=Caenorhabditis japonica TaxID=281687 RepID=A0A8R1J341_CAEJA